MSYIVPIRQAAVPLWAALQDCLTEARRVPCTDRDEWVSESPEDREYAAAHCGGCPVRGACHAYAEAARERFAVWAGTDRTAPRAPNSSSIPLFAITKEKTA